LPSKAQRWHDRYALDEPVGLVGLPNQVMGLMWADDNVGENAVCKAE